MYVSTKAFKLGDVSYSNGEVIPSPSSKMIELGLVRRDSANELLLDNSAVVAFIAGDDLIVEMFEDSIEDVKTLDADAHNNSKYILDADSI